jgi:hypothetical protein
VRSRPSRWAWLVAASSLILVAAGGAMAVWWWRTASTDTTSYAVQSPVSRVEIVVDAGDIEVLGGGPLQVAVRRDHRFAYDQSPTERRTFADGVLHIESSCPPIILGRCSASYRVTVPDNVPIVVRGGAGTVRLTAYRGAADVVTGDGAIVVDAFCGFELRARSRNGDVRVGTACPPERLDLRSGTGDVSAVVPSGRYRVDADSTSGDVRITDVLRVVDAPWEIHAVSSEGNVTIEGAR